MTWAAAKAELVTVLAGVTITAPVAQSIRRVYPDPPGAITDVPAAVIFPPPVEVQRPAGSFRIKSYDVPVQLFILDADLDRAAALIDAYREEIIDAFDDAFTLSGTATQASVTRVGPGSRLEYGGRSYAGMEVTVWVEIKETYAFVP